MYSFVVTAGVFCIISALFNLSFFLQYNYARKPDMVYPAICILSSIIWVIVRTWPNVVDMWESTAEYKPSLQIASRLMICILYSTLLALVPEVCAAVGVCTVFSIGVILNYLNV